MMKLRNFLSENKGICSLLITLVALAVFKLSPWLAENLYRKFLFQAFRLVWDYTLGLLPFPLIYLLLLVLPFALYQYGKKFARKWNTLFLFPLNLFGWIGTFFFCMWGFNYFAPAVIADSSVSLTENELYLFGLEIAEDVNRLDEQGVNRELLKLQTIEYDDGSLVQTDVKKFLAGKGLRAMGKPKCHFLRDAGLMRRLGVAGIYLPFIGQGQSSQTMHYLYKPFVAAHELSHAYGITGEGEADFVAYKSLTQPSILYENEKKYCADIELLRSIRSQLYVLNDSLRVEIDSLLRPTVMKDISELRENAKLYPEYFEGLQQSMNDAYLKTMGINDGALNYDRFVAMAWCDRKQYHH